MAAEEAQAEMEGNSNLKKNTIRKKTNSSSKKC